MAKLIIFSNLEEDSVDLEDVRRMLDVEVDGRILGIADIGLWNGRKKGYGIFGRKISSIFRTSCDYAEWFGDTKKKSIEAVMHHHDGTNYVEYRVIRENRNIEKLLDKIYNNLPVSREEINYYTRSLYPFVAEILGW